MRAVVVLAMVGALVAAGVDARGRQPEAVSGPFVLDQRPFELVTHCGIQPVTVGSRVYVPVSSSPEAEQSGRAWWDQPFQSGTMAFFSDGGAVFTDARGHRLEFHADPQADQPWCE